MKYTINTLVLLLVLTVSAVAQSYSHEESNDRANLYVGFTNISVPFDNFQGINGQAQVKLVRFGVVRIDVAGDLAVFFPGGIGDVELYTFQAGPRAGVDIGKKVTLFGGIHFGAFTTFNSDATYSYLPGGGIQVKLNKRVYVQGEYGRQFLQDAPFSFNRLSFGVGGRF